ncbi:hypothetical protein LJR084_007791 [Variovorax sp. LjRoot84]|uniref:hypothetical protein n=1 Tax=Variovorax sp. LjRoot84 TaxID=3342340 RepID=UPI003ECE5400
MSDTRHTGLSPGRRTLRLSQRSVVTGPRMVARPEWQGFLPAAQPRAELLRSAEWLLRALLRKSRSKLPRGERRAWLEAMRRFDPIEPMVVLAPEQVRGAAWLLAAMHWCGFRHPGALHCKPLHPPTGLVRWLSTFDVCRQMDRPVDIMRSLVLEMERVDRESRRPRRGDAGAWTGGSVAAGTAAVIGSRFRYRQG